MRLRQRRSGKVASGKRAARGHWDIRKRKRAPGKGARNIRSAVTSRRPCGAQSNWGYESSGRALRACHWLPSFRACRREFVLVITSSVGKLYHYRLRAVLDSFLETSV